MKTMKHPLVDTTSEQIRRRLARICRPFTDFLSYIVYQFPATEGHQPLIQYHHMVGNLFYLLTEREKEVAELRKSLEAMKPPSDHYGEKMRYKVGIKDNPYRMFEQLIEKMDALLLATLPAGDGTSTQSTTDQVAQVQARKGDQSLRTPRMNTVVWLSRMQHSTSSAVAVVAKEGRRLERELAQLQANLTETQANLKRTQRAYVQAVKDKHLEVQKREEAEVARDVAEGKPSDAIDQLEIHDS